MTIAHGQGGSAAQSLDAQKARLRRQMRLRRKKAHGQQPDAGRRVSDLLAPFLGSVHGPVASYWAIGSELDLASLFETLALDWCLPVITSETRPLIFRAYEPGAALEIGAHEIPVPSAKAPTVQPEVLLVPLLAFDEHGGRLGQGGGYYDRTLAALGPTVYAVGVAYEDQRLDTVPMGSHDRPLDAVATPSNLIQFRPLSSRTSS